MVESISKEQPGGYTINDQEGSFTLIVNSNGDSVVVKKDYPSQPFEVSLQEFLSAAYQWMEEGKKYREPIF